MKIGKIIKDESDLIFAQSIGSPFFIHFEKWDKQGFPLSRRRSERKAWVYSACINENFIAAMAIVDAGYLSTAFAYIYDFNKGIFHEEKALKPFGFAENFRPSLSEAWYFKDGKKTWNIENQNDTLFCSFSCQELTLNWQLDLSSDGLNALAESPNRPFNYTYKNVLLPIKTEASYQGRYYNCLGKNGVVDFSAGYPPRNTRWNWASLNGKTQQGELFALNLVEHHNSGLENGIWLGNKIIPLKEAHFHYNPPIEKNPTIIECAEVNLKIQFLPKGARKEKINLLALVSDFVQTFGYFSGSFVSSGATLEVSGVGVVEDHRALW